MHSMSGKCCWCVFRGCQNNLLDLDSVRGIGRLLRESLELSSMHLCNLISKSFSPQGLTFVGILSESHISIHTWPESGSLTIDIQTCGSEGNTVDVIDYFRKHFKPVTEEINTFSF